METSVAGRVGSSHPYFVDAKCDWVYRRLLGVLIGVSFGNVTRLSGKRDK